MKPASNSLCESAKLAVDYLLRNRDAVQKQTQTFALELKVDPRRLSEVFQVLEAIRWIQRDRRSFVLVPNTQLCTTLQKLEDELKTREIRISFKSDNCELALGLLKLLFSGFQGTTVQCAEQLGQALWNRRIADIAIVLVATEYVQRQNNVLLLNRDIRRALEAKVQACNGCKYLGTQTETLPPHKIFSQDTRAEGYTPRAQQAVDALVTMSQEALISPTRNWLFKMDGNEGSPDTENPAPLE